MTVWKRYLFVAFLTLALAGLDQASKQWAQASLAEAVQMKSRPACMEDGPVETRTVYHGGYERRIRILPGSLDLRYVQNCGGAWGLMRNTSHSVRRPFFVLASLFAIGFMVWITRRLRPDQTLLRWALPFVLGGAMGNFIDRVRYHYVIDFIDMYIGSFHWPTYNLADVAICVGVGLMILDLRPRRATGPG